jgi:hypothetical protein
VLLSLCWLLPAPADVRAPEDAIYVYDLFQGAPTCSELQERVAGHALRSTIILSVEQGPDFLLDQPFGEAALGCVLNHARGGSRWVKALFLQDPGFLSQPEEAVRRAALLGDFAARHPGLLAGVQVNIEPYVSKDWTRAGPAQRRRILARLAALLADLRAPLKGLPLGLTVSWWYPAVTAEIPEAAPEAWLRVADEVYVMAYGDAGGPLVGGSARRVLERVHESLFAGRGRVHLAVAAHEYRSPQHLDGELATIRERLAAYPGFAGTAVFHAASPFDVPLVRVLVGTVKDPRNRALAGVVVRAGKLRAQTEEDGRFTLRGLPGERADLVLSRPGFRARRLRVELAQPGLEQDLGRITLRWKERPVSGPAPAATW